MCHLSLLARHKISLWCHSNFEVSTSYQGASFDEPCIIININYENINNGVLVFISITSIEADFILYILGMGKF